MRLRRFLASRQNRILIVSVISIASLWNTGCVRRRMTVRSSPPGAVVYVDDQEIGMTPVSTPFTYYGTRKIQLFKDGYQTETALQRISPPWYQFPPLDFITENLWPGELKDERILDFEMQQQQVVPSSDLRARAERLRTSALQGVATPLPSVPPTFSQPPRTDIPFFPGQTQPSSF